mgnify:CR=1 FL=1
MEIILGIATLLGGVTAIWFFWDKYHDSRKIKNFVAPLNSAPHEPPVDKVESRVFGAFQSGREPFFISEPKHDIKSAKSEASKHGKLAFLVIYDEDHPTKSKLFYSLGCFMDYFTTKKLVDDHFVPALVSSKNHDAAELVPSDDPLENCLWVVLRKDGEILVREGVYANPDEGLKRVRRVIEQNL